MTHKYIVMQHEGEEAIFIFPRNVDHDRMFEVLEAIRFDVGGGDWVRKYRQGEAISAGFVANNKCTGRSETLGLNAREQEDTALLRSAMGI